jgi:hypothetical protein
VSRPIRTSSAAAVPPPSAFKDLTQNDLNWVVPGDDTDVASAWFISWLASIAEARVKYRAIVLKRRISMFDLP